MKALVRKTDKRIMHIICGSYGGMYREDCWVVPIPDQDISHLYLHDDAMDLDTIVETYYPGSMQVYDRGLIDLAIDPNTGDKINRQLHQSAGVDEAIGILRDQLVFILNALGIEPTDDFSRFNEIAIAEIEKGQIEKEAL